MITKPQRIRLANFLYGNVQTELSTLSPATFYVGLSTAAMGDDGTISGEVSGNGYSRVAVANNKTSFNTATADGTVFNQVNISWNEAVASWGTIKTVFFAPSASANPALYYIPVNKEVPAGATIYFKGTTSGGDLTLSVVN